MAKKYAKKGRKRGRKPASRVTDLGKALADLDEQRARIVRDAIAGKKSELAKARQELSAAQKRVADLEGELNTLGEDAGVAAAPAKRGPGRPPAGAKKGRRGRPKGSRNVKKAAGRGPGRPKKSGRKSRVSVETKRSHIADALKNYPKGIEFSTLRADLLGAKDPNTGENVFSAPDFNSSVTFGQRLLPQGWKIQGERRNARVVKK